MYSLVWRKVNPIEHWWGGTFESFGQNTGSEGTQSVSRDLGEVTSPSNLIQSSPSRSCVHIRGMAKNVDSLNREDATVLGEGLIAQNWRGRTSHGSRRVSSRAGGPERVRLTTCSKFRQPDPTEVGEVPAYSAPAAVRFVALRYPPVLVLEGNPRQSVPFATTPVPYGAQATGD